MNTAKNVALVLTAAWLFAVTLWLLYLTVWLRNVSFVLSFRE